jgi:mRNA-degrading endonuclease YafQ of YafQ-DinJ toxin-antitoxin module
MDIFYTAKFAREYKKVSSKIKQKAEKREVLFRKNPFNAILKTHKLHGDLSEFWSFSIDFRYRIIFELNEDQTTAVFYSIGDHDVYK